MKFQRALRSNSNLLFGGLAFGKILAEGRVGRKEGMTTCRSWQPFEVFLLKVPAELGCKSNPPGVWGLLVAPRGLGQGWGVTTAGCDTEQRADGVPAPPVILEE